jgi:hypothetical protein
MAKGGQTQETPQQRAFSQVAQARLADWKTRVAPVLKHFSANVIRSGGENSWERKRASGMASTDTAAAFAPVHQAAIDNAATSGAAGSSRQKLGIASTGNDLATSASMGEVSADQAVDTNYVQGLQTVSALGRGERATASSGLAASAALSGQQAQADAQLSLERDIGTASLAGKAIGMGAGLASAPTAPNTEDYRGTILPPQLRGGGG